MNKKKFQTFFDCGFSKVRGGTFNKENQKEAFYVEGKFLTDHSNLEFEIQKIITSLEKNTDEYIDNINLMVDSPNMLSIGISISKKFDGAKLKKANVQFLIQEAKQLIFKHHTNYNITHIIINNYKIDGVDYSYLPNEIKCHLISLDILFICLPSDLIFYFKEIFSKSNISINQIICSSYAKSINYKDKLNLSGRVSFIDVGLNKTSITSYLKDTIISLDVLPIGGNHITKDISKVLKVSLNEAENIKLNFDKNLDFLKEKKFSLELCQEIIFARTEEILELCVKSMKINSTQSAQFKMVLMGEGSRILDNSYTHKISFSNELDFLEETKEDICQSGFKLCEGLNKREVLAIPKKLIKHGFFEKLFHFFK